MLTKTEIIDKARELGFDDIGFTTAESFPSQLEYIDSGDKRYDWTEMVGLKLKQSIDPRVVFEEAKSIIVLLHCYLRDFIPASMTNHFGRCYVNDDRVTKDGLAERIKAFRGYLRDNGINSKCSASMPDKLAAARAGLGTFGKNTLFYASGCAKGSSWVSPIAVVIDHEFESDEPTVKNGCPDWCRNACVAACPTRALKGNGTIEPSKCISYLTYYGNTITPLELREPMGMNVYGCDRCQLVCPRNQPWIASDLPQKEKINMKSQNFDMIKLLHMDREYFDSKIWPHMFYMSYKDMWKWKMNVARAMGNSLDEKYVPELVKAYNDNDDERVKIMCLWALGRIGSADSIKALKDFIPSCEGVLGKEAETALHLAGGR